MGRLKWSAWEGMVLDVAMLLTVRHGLLSRQVQQRETAQALKALGVHISSITRYHIRAAPSLLEQNLDLGAIT